MRISERTAGMLEWPDFLRFFGAYISSPAAQTEVSRIRPVDSPQQELQLTGEVLTCAVKEGLPSLAAAENVTNILRKSSIENQILEGVELYKVYRLAEASNAVRAYAGRWRSEFPRLSSRCSALPDLRELEKEIGAKIESTGQLKDDATPELVHLQRQILHIKDRVEHALERYLKDDRYSGAFQEDYVTYRNGRAVLLLRADHKKSIRGFIHGESGSGASLFLEPLQVLELNNDLAQLTDRLNQEKLRILEDLTAFVGSQSQLLVETLERLIDLDLLFARGRYGSSKKCVIPEIGRDMRLVLKQARHPLLQEALNIEKKEMVPFHFELPSEKKALVVTGPNTGGKTVFLKTIGLLSLMAHCALPVPAQEGTVFPELDSIQADIGDQQSISQSLSTFSSHIMNIVRILSGLTERSLLLLDELGTGTDPEEGSALAVAVLDELLSKNVKVVVTSHHTQVKIFAFNHPHCLSAAMEFDETNLQPTYRVLVDQVGASHAFETAARLGISTSILNKARELVEGRQNQIHEFQSRLQEKLRELESKEKSFEEDRIRRLQAVEKEERRIREMSETLETRLKKLNQENIDLIRTIHARWEGLLETVDNVRVRQALRKEFEEQMEPQVQRLQQIAPPPPPKSETFQPGDRVWVNLYKEFGEVVQIKKEQAEVIIRNKRFTVPPGTLEKRESAVTVLPKGIHLQREEKEVATEISVRGQTVEDALAAVDKYLDDAFLAQLPQVRLIHGHGTGKLRRAIEEMLSTHPHVKRFYQERQERGGSGVTVAELKQ